MTSRLAARMGAVWAAAALLIPAFAVVKQPIAPHDVWWQLAYGRAIALEHAVPRTDAFSFTRAGEAFFDQPWLAQLAMYSVERAGGMAALVCVQALVVACAMGLLLLAARARTGDTGAAARGVLFFALPLSLDNWGIRPQTWALVPFAVFVLVLARWRAGRAPMAWLLPIAMLVWVNVHGSFVLGLALVPLGLAGWAAERILRREIPNCRVHGIHLALRLCVHEESVPRAVNLVCEWNSADGHDRPPMSAPNGRKFSLGYETERRHESVVLAWYGGCADR